MSANTPQNEPDGQSLGPSIHQDAEDGRVASGDRREEVHFETDPGQLVKASHLVRPDGPLPPQEHSPSQERGELPLGPEPLDVRVAPEGPSVWDARPPAEDADKSGNPTGR